MIICWSTTVFDSLNSMPSRNMYTRSLLIRKRIPDYAKYFTHCDEGVNITVNVTNTNCSSLHPLSSEHSTVVIPLCVSPLDLFGTKDFWIAEGCSSFLVDSKVNEVRKTQKSAKFIPFTNIKRNSINRMIWLWGRNVAFDSLMFIWMQSTFQRTLKFANSVKFSRQSSFRFKEHTLSALLCDTHSCSLTKLYKANDSYSSHTNSWQTS